MVLNRSHVYQGLGVNLSLSLGIKYAGNTTHKLFSRFGSGE
jgi:hypothetical protein